MGKSTSTELYLIIMQHFILILVSYSKLKHHEEYII